jgi:hypothetical protein
MFASRSVFRSSFDSLQGTSDQQWVPSFELLKE